MYDPKSKVASEFICHEEIEETLAFAQEHKHNREYIQKALKKAEDMLRKTGVPRVEHMMKEYPFQLSGGQRAGHPTAQ